MPRDNDDITMEPYARMQIRNSDLPRLRIRDHVKALIVAGKLAPGAEIPSTRRLAALWTVDVATVHAALSDLVKERLVIRRHGKGTFVAQKIKRLHRVGLYVNMTSLSDPTKWFVRSVLVEIQKHLMAQGIDVQAWMDPRPKKDRKTVWTDLEASARRKEIQGLILLDCDSDILKWAQALPIPLAGITPLKLPFAVNCDWSQLFELGMRRLAAQGCRSLGLITVHPMVAAYENYYKQLLEMAEHYNLKIKNSWIRIPPDSAGVGGFELARYGYREFHALWDQSSRPDGLIIEPDIVVEGAMMAMLQRGVSVPDDIKIVFHRNGSHEYLCPFPATQVITSEKDYATALVEQIERQVAGEVCESTSISYHLVDYPGEKRS